MVTADQEVEFYRHVLRAGHLDGLIVGVSLMDDPILPLMINDPLPLVLLGHHPYYPQASWVEVDGLQSAAEAVSYLIRSGRRRIATITLPLTLIAGLDRRDGYKRALLQHRMPIDPDLIIETESFTNGGYIAAQRLLALPDPPDAIFAASDSLAIGAMSAIRAAGLRVPEDIAVVGFDDQPSATLADPPLTTVRQPIAELGTRAVELLLTLIEGETKGPQHVMLPTSLVMRASA
jgi:LacI family transcriptional regulator